VIITGWFNTVGGAVTVDFGGGPLSCDGSCIFVAKLDPSGEHIWSKSCGNAFGYDLGGTNPGDFVAVDGAGNIVVAGGFGGRTGGGSVDFGAGPHDTDAAGDLEMFVAKLDLNGSELWTRSWGSMGTQIGATDVAVDSADNVIVSGWLSAGSVDLGGGVALASFTAAEGPGIGEGQATMFAAKLDANGSAVWGRSLSAAQMGYGGSNDQWMSPSVAVATNGDVWLTGNYMGAPDFGGGALLEQQYAGAFVAMLDGGGGDLWAEGFSPDSQFRSVGLGIATDAAGNAVAVGGFWTSLDVGAIQLTATPPGSLNGFVARVRP